MRKIMYAVLCILCVLCFGSGIAAASGQTTFVSVGNDSGFTVSPFTPSPIMPMSIAGNITGVATQGSNEIFEVDVDHGATTIDICVTWDQEPDYNVLLVAFLSASWYGSPAYYDEDDGTVDGMITLTITANPGTTLAAGTWYFIVGGESVVDTQPFTLTINCS
jgi:hypothetical protein